MACVSTSYAGKWNQELQHVNKRHVSTKTSCFPLTLWCYRISPVWESESGQITHWGRVTHICVGNPTIIGPDNSLSPGRHQAIIWTNAGILLIGPWGTNFSEILIGIHTFSFKKIHLKMSSAKWRPFFLGLNVFNRQPTGVFVFRRKNTYTGRPTKVSFLTSASSSQIQPLMMMIYVWSKHGVNAETQYDIV